MMKMITQNKDAYEADFNFVPVAASLVAIYKILENMNELFRFTGLVLWFQ